MITALVSVLFALVVLNGWMFLQQPGMIFFPARGLQATPADWAMSYEDVSLKSADGIKLHGWYIPAARAERVVLFLHGNAGNISHRGESIAIFRRLGLDVFIFDYRGYGGSDGEPSEAGLYQDAAAAWRYLVETRGVSPGNIVVFGRSLGGAVAAQLASRVQPQPGGLILESTLSSARDFAKAAFPLLSRVLVVRYQFDSVARLAQVRCPVLVLHSPTDEIMPYRLGEKLYQSAHEPKRFVALRGDHNSGFMQSQPQYEQALGEFIAALVPVDSR
ncbi:MAG: alpha/beta hydrolase [Thiogranum sp.]|jgi:hypothetical protein